MHSDRAQRYVDQFLDEAEAAISDLNFGVVRDRAQVALAFDPENIGAPEFEVAAERTPGQSVIENSLEERAPSRSS